MALCRMWERAHVGLTLYSFAEWWEVHIMRSSYVGDSWIEVVQGSICGRRSMRLLILALP